MIDIIFLVLNVHNWQGLLNNTCWWELDKWAKIGWHLKSSNGIEKTNNWVILFWKIICTYTIKTDVWHNKWKSLLLRGHEAPPQHRESAGPVVCVLSSRVVSSSLCPCGLPPASSSVHASSGPLNQLSSWRVVATGQRAVVIFLNN